MCWIFVFFGVGWTQTLDLKDVVKAIEKNSLELVNNKAQFESLLSEGKSNLAWEYPYLDTEGGTAQENGRIGGEWSAVFLVKPKLWWVNPLLRDSLKSKNMQYQKSHILIRNISFIGVKRIYLTYIATKEKYQYYLTRERNFLQLLGNAKKRLEGGSISRKDYVSFESAYIDSTLASLAVQNELIELQRMLFMILGLDKQGYVSHFEQGVGLNNSLDSLGYSNVTLSNWEIAKDTNVQNVPSQTMSEDLQRRNQTDANLNNIMALQGYNLEILNSNTSDSNLQNQNNNLDKKTSSLALNQQDIVINDLQFNYIEVGRSILEEKLKNSLYTEILDLQAKEYQYLGQYEGRNHWNALEFGAGVNYSLSRYNPTFQLSVPLPVTKKQSHLKAKYMALENGAVSKSMITKKQIAIKAHAYLKELSLQKHYINIAKNNTEVKQHLAELNRLAYETQQVTLFEYITQANAFVDSQIELVNSQIKYINLVAFLEETLGESFTDINN